MGSIDWVREARGRVASREGRRLASTQVVEFRNSPQCRSARSRDRLGQSRSAPDL